MKLAVYKILPLLLIFNGCYTMILDPLRIREAPPENIKTDKYYNGEEVFPIVNRSIYSQYNQSRQYPYDYLPNGNYYNNPYQYTGYNPVVDQTRVVLSREEYLQLKAAQTPLRQPPKVDAAAQAERKHRRADVWKRRNEHRGRLAPKVTRREKNEE